MTRYSHIVFDIDGTLLDTEAAVMTALKQTLLEITGKEYTNQELKWTLGIPGLKALEQLNVQDPPAALRRWEQLLQNEHHQMKVFDGIKTTLNQLQNMGCHLGIVTSKTRQEVETDFSIFGLDSYFERIIDADSTTKHKPDADPLFEYMKQTNANPEEVLYIGDSIHDQNCAKAAGVDFGTALWGAPFPEKMLGTWTFDHPNQITDLISRQ